MDSSTYRHLLGQIKSSCPIPHYNFPCHNLLSVETLFGVSKDLNDDNPDDCENEFLSSFPCYESFPYAVHCSSVFLCGSGATDHAADLVRRKLNWEKKLNNLKLSNVNAAIKSIRKLRNNEVVKLSSNLKKYIEHFHCDPEPMFSGNYNWLYTGGCLNLVEKSDETNLISCDFFAKKPGFYLLELNENQDIVHKSFCQLKTYSPVLQVIGRSYNENLVICARQKKYLSLFNINKVCSFSQPVRLWRKKVSGSKLLTCADVKPNCEEVIVADSNHDVNVFHVEEKNKIYAHSGRKMAFDCVGDAWSQIEFGDHGLYWALRNRFVILDFRDFSSGIKLNYEPSAATNPCEHISSFARSLSDSNFLYLTTTHSVLQVDLRNKKAVQRWTHLMKKPPQFMAIMKDEEENEVLLLQSSVVDEILGITNECKKNGENVNFVSKSLPCLLNNIKESLNLARLRGICLNPSVSKRVNFSVTGIQCLKNIQGDFILFTTNSGGDIFLSKIKKKALENFHTEENEIEIIKTMKMYESHLDKFQLKNPMRSHVKLADMSRVLEDFQDAAEETEVDEKRNINWRFHEMYSSESLKFFRDVLAQKILSVWSPPDPNTEELDLDDAIMSVDVKVKEWMEKC